jgi:hypothetical protein
LELLLEGKEKGKERERKEKTTKEKRRKSAGQNLE